VKVKDEGRVATTFKYREELVTTSVVKKEKEEGLGGGSRGCQERIEASSQQTDRGSWDLDVRRAEEESLFIGWKNKRQRRMQDGCRGNLKKIGRRKVHIRVAGGKGEAYGPQT